MVAHGATGSAHYSLLGDTQESMCLKQLSCSSGHTRMAAPALVNKQLQVVLN
jgi:hypothetical protein